MMTPDNAEAIISPRYPAGTPKTRVTASLMLPAGSDRGDYERLYHDRGFNSPCSICPNLYGKHKRSNGQQVNRRLLGL